MAKAKKKKQSLNCPKCNSLYSRDEEFCGECGERLKKKPNFKKFFLFAALLIVGFMIVPVVIQLIGEDMVGIIALILIAYWIYRVYKKKKQNKAKV